MCPNYRSKFNQNLCVRLCFISASFPGNICTTLLKQDKVALTRYAILDHAVRVSIWREALVCQSLFPVKVGLMIPSQAEGFGFDARLLRDWLTSSVEMQRREAAFFSCCSADGPWQLHTLCAQVLCTVLFSFPLFTFSSSITAGCGY